MSSARTSLGTADSANPVAINSTETTTPKFMLTAKFRNFTSKKDAVCNPAFLISIGQKHKRFFEEDKILEAFVHSIDQQVKAGKYNKVTILAAGALQRHNWWLFTKDYSDAELSSLLADLPDDLTKSEIALFLAEKFLLKAKNAEEAYLANYKRIFDKLEKVFEIKRWFDDLPEDSIRNSTAIVDSIANAHQTYLKDSEKLRNIYNNNPLFQQAICETVKNFIQRNLAEIESEGARLHKANAKLEKFSSLELAEAGSQNYLFEESPYLIPGLSKAGITHIFYPGGITPALRETRTLFNLNDKLEWVDIKYKRRNREKMEQEADKLVTTLQSQPSSPELLSRDRVTHPNVLAYPAANPYRFYNHPQTKAASLGVEEHKSPESTPNNSPNTGSPSKQSAVIPAGLFQKMLDKLKYVPLDDDDVELLDLVTSPNKFISSSDSDETPTSCHLAEKSSRPGTPTPTYGQTS